jgi:flagellar hook-associated protein 1 FlgK
VSLTSLLNIARSALAARQAQLDTTGHNIANADTPGYTRQRVRLAAGTPLRTTAGQLGTGVSILGIERVRSRHLDDAFRSESASHGESSTLNESLGQIEALIGEPGTSGLSSSLDAYWAAWGDLANDPSGGAARSIVRQRGTQLVAKVQDLAGRFDTARSDVTMQLGQDLDQINSITRRLAELNRGIAVAESAGGSAPDLRDQRDQLIDQLGALVPVRALERPDGTVGLLVGDALVVDGGSSRELATAVTPGGGTAIVFRDGAVPAAVDGGRVRAYLDLINTRIPELSRQLDDLAQAVVEEVNSRHRGGFTKNGLTGTDFFAPTGVTAATMALTPAIVASTDAIAAGTTGAPGDGTLALAIAGLRTTGMARLGGQTAGAYFTDAVTTLGAIVADSGQRMTTQETLLTEIDNQRQSVAGVSVDEELANLIGYQQAYVAATRVITAADQMMQELLRMV